MKARDVLELATVGGATVAGLGSIVGSISPGKAADLILTRTDSIHMAPAADPIAALVLYAHPSDIDTVLVGGREAKAHGKLVGVNWSAIRARLEASADRIHAAFARAPLARIERIAAQLMLGET